MHNKSAPALPKLLHHHARIFITGIFVIRNKDDDRLCFKDFKPFSSNLDGVSKRCPPSGHDRLNLPDEFFSVKRAKGNQFFHILAVAFPPVSVSQQTDILAVRQCIDNIY